MINYKDHFKSYCEGSTIYEFEEIPQNRDLFILGAEDFNNCLEHWKKYLDGSGVAHPNTMQNYRNISITHNSNNLIDLFLEVNIHTRFHGIHKKLPKRKFIFCIEFWSWDEKPYIIVDQDWFNLFLNDTYSIYALIDFIGIRSIIEKEGLIPHNLINNLKETLFHLSNEYTDYMFFAFADNIIIKKSWSSKKESYKKSYHPEHLLKLIELVFRQIETTLHLKSYAIISQGSNLIEEEKTSNFNISNNYFFFDSIATPFIELFEIDDNVRELIRIKKINPKSLYLARSFLLSLNFTNHEYKCELGKQCIKFEPKKSGVTLNSYLPIDMVDLLKLIDNQDY